MKFTSLTNAKTIQKETIQAISNGVKGDKYIYLLAGVHGDEIEGIHVCEQLTKWLETTELSLPIIVIPILNLDGYHRRTRGNFNGVDLNRNLPSTNWSKTHTQKKYYPGQFALSEPENKFLKSIFDQYLPGIIFSFHSWKRMYNYNGQCQNVVEFLHKFNPDYPMVAEIEGHITPGSLGEWGPEAYQSPVLTFEFPEVALTGETLDEIWLENKQGLTELFKSDLLRPYLV